MRILDLSARFRLGGQTHLRRVLHRVVCSLDPAVCLREQLGHTRFFEGSLQPSMANMALPIKPCALHTISTSRNTASTSLPSVATKCAKVVKWGCWSQARAMKVTFSMQARAIAREEVMPVSRQTAPP